MLKIPELKELDKEFKKIIQKELSPLKIIEDSTIKMFKQTWGSTLLGFDTGCNWGGDAMTDSYTTVIQLDYLDSNRYLKTVYGVFFGDDFAYMVSDVNERFYEDLKNCDMCSVSEKSKYSEI